MRVLGLDVGEKRIGVAKVDSDTRIAVPIGFIPVDGSEWQEIGRYLRLNGTSFVVIGLPRSNEGNETKQSVYVRNFAKTLAEKLPEAKIRFQDESLTSVVAEERLKSRKKRYEKGEIDAEAAAIILEDFIEGYSGVRNFPLRTVRDQRGAREATEPCDDGREGAGPKREIAKSHLGDNTNIIKKETDKVKLKTRKLTKWISGGAILVILALLATGGYLWIKDLKAKERAEYYAKLEAEMEPEVFNFTILPGETISEVKARLIEVGYTKEEVEAGFSANYDFDFLKGRPAGASLEGYLFGDTHEFYQNASVKEILEVFLGEMGRVIKENNLEARYAEKGLSLFEGITLASIVQKEAPSPAFNAEQPTVAQVFLSRLKYNIPLGSDVTVSYALDIEDPNRTTYTDNQSALRIDSCYNTRLYVGMPCGPISNPGLSALLAVAEPSDTAYLYFLTGDDGLMYYSSTEYEHTQNIYRHCQKLCNVSL